MKNVYSFAVRDNGDSEEFSMIAGKVRSKKDHIWEDGNLKLLKFAAVYGANASGKSNLVKAMELMRQIVLFGNLDAHTEKYCKVDLANRNKPSYFEIEVKLGEKYYAYGFEVILNQGKLISEWLVELHADNSEKDLFVRDIITGEYSFGGDLARKGLKNKLNVYADDMREDGSALFLSVMNQHTKNLYSQYKSAQVLQKLFFWFRHMLDISHPDEPISDYMYLSETDQTDEVCRLISAFGTGITGFKMVDVSREKVMNSLPKRVQEQVAKQLAQQQLIVRNTPGLSSLNMVMRTRNDFFIISVTDSEKVIYQTIEFNHDGRDAQYNLSEESDGTVRVLDLLEILLAGEGKTYVIDELDRCLHPSLTYKFVETFFQVAAQKDIQLIATTHESRLLDFDLLRRDEIWFINKKQSGESDIYSLEEYNARFDQKIDKAYLEGRYGGVPIFSSIFPVKGE